MKVTGLKWAGTRTEHFSEMVSFFRDVMKLPVEALEEGFAWFVLPNGDEVEVFGAEDPDHGHFTTGPVVGFGVTDIEEARHELESSGIDFIGPIHGQPGGRWSHFYGPDRNVYEITGP